MKSLFPFAGNPRSEMPKGLPFKLTDYLSLVDETARIQRDDKRGFMKPHHSPVLERLDLDKKVWLEITQQFEHKFKRFAGDPEHIKALAQSMNYQRTPDISSANHYFT